MKWKIINRKLHYWASLLIALQIAIIACTGSLLLLKKKLNWVEPTTQHGVGQTPQISFNKILTQLKTVHQVPIKHWSDVERIDIRPKQGVIKVRAQDRWEVQLDAQTGKILQVQRRNASLIASIHTGTWFHPLARYWIFLPTALVLLMMVITGSIMAITRLRSSRKTSYYKNDNKAAHPS